MNLKKFFIGLSLLALSACQTQPVVTPSPSPSESSVVQISYALEDNEAFRQYLDELLKETLSSSESVVLQFVKDPANFDLDINKVAKGLGADYSKESMDKQLDMVQKDFNELIQFDYESLSRKQQDIYDTLYFDMDMSLKLSDPKFNYYDQPFSTMSGIQSSLVTTIQHLRIESKEDVDMALSILDSIPSFIDSALSYSQTQIELNTLITNADEVIEACNNFINDSDQPLLNLLIDNVNALEAITSNEKEEINQQLTLKYDAIVNSYQKIVDFFTINKDNINQGGYASLPNGKEYYTLLAQLEMGCEFDMENFSDSIDSYVLKYAFKLMNILNNHQDDKYYLNYLNDQNFLNFASYREIIDFAKSNLKDYVPKIQEVEVEIYDLPESIATPGVLAYYLYPELDDYLHQTICVNPFTADLSSLSTYTTVNHEGYLGHLYQTTYAYQNNPDSSIIKVLYAPTANVEGYARYSEYLALCYLNQWDEDQINLYLFNEMIYGLQVLQLDYGIHYLGWDLQQCTDYFNENIGDVTLDDVQPLYEQLRCNPAAFNPYEFGNLVYMQLREKALDSLGSNFNEIDFNTSLLNASHTPLKTLQRSVDEYISQNEKAFN